jgi:MarR family transcriptional regulator for hemolysin
MPPLNSESLGVLLHGTARAWRLKLDERLKPLGMSQARWRTLLHLSWADQPLTQAEIAARLGIEEPTLVNLLHRLEEAGWVKRASAPHDRRCKTVTLQRRAHRVIGRIDQTASQLRHELLSEIPRQEIAICMRVLATILAKAEQAPAVATNGKGVPRTKGKAQ